MLANEQYYKITKQLISKSIGSRTADRDQKAEDDKAKIMQCISFTEKLFPRVVLSLCRESHDHVSYISPYCNDILGLSSEYLKSLSIHGFIKLIHKDDIKGFNDCLAYVVSQKIDLREEYRIQYYYRIKNTAEEIVYVEDERIVMDSGSGRSVYLGLLKNITADSSFGGTKVKIYKRVNGRYLLLQEYQPRAEVNGLTARQRDIINLIMMGLGNQEIAERLSLSIYTIKNHKQTLFRKLGIGTSLELTSLIKNINGGSSHEGIVSDTPQIN
jgi:DNA-binding CsgD family transcriptional regulator